MLHMWLNSDEVQLPVGKMWFYSHPNPVTSGWSLQKRPVWRDTCAGLKERCESHGESDECMSLHASSGAECLHAHKWAASCHDDFTSSFFMYSTVECAVAWQGRVHRLDTGRGRDKEGKPPFLFIRENPSFPQISPSSGAWQAGLWIKTSKLWKFSLNQTCSSSSRCCDFM